MPTEVTRLRRPGQDEATSTDSGTNGCGVFLLVIALICLLTLTMRIAGTLAEINRRLTQLETQECRP